MTEPPARRTARDRILGAALPLAAAAATALVFAPALSNGFVNWDDQINFLNNPAYRGLRWSNLRWMFTTVLMGHYIPVTWLTLGLDYVVWGMEPFGYHLTNVLLHAANAALVALLALRLLARATGASGTALRAGALAAALVFAIHPLRAESVAWITERRDVLSGFFFLLTILLYVAAAERVGAPRRRLLAASVACYLLAMGSKSIVMSLPLVLVVLDVYPLRRLPGDPRTWLRPVQRRLWLEKLPYLVIAIAGAVVAYHAVAVNAFLTPIERYPWSARVGMVAFSLWFYASKTVLPLALSPLYELPATIDPLRGRFLLSLVGSAAITVAGLVLRRRWPAGLATWVYYGIVIAPVSGLVHAGHQLANDRYSYLSCLGFAVLAGGGVSVVVRWAATGRLGPRTARLAAAGGALALAGLGALTWVQVGAWHDSDTLWRTAIEADPSCSICQANLGVTLVAAGQVGLAKEHFERVVNLRPDRIRTHLHLGLALANLGQLQEAVDQFQRVLARYPDDAAALTNLAVTLGLLGRHAEALEHLRHAARVDPAGANVQANLGGALLELDRPGEALHHYLRAVELDPKLPLARFGLARTYLALGREDDARREQEVLRRLDPRLADRLKLPATGRSAALAR